MILADKSRSFTKAYHMYNRWLLRRSFEQIYLDDRGRMAEGRPTLFIANHSNWWDPLLVLQLNGDILKKDMYAMMAPKGLKKEFRFFHKLGGFSVNPDSTVEIQRSLRYSVQLLSEAANRALWLFPQGEMQHQEIRPIQLMSGLGSIVERMYDLQVVPVLFYYTYDGNRKPSVYIRITDALVLDEECRKRKIATRIAQEALQTRLDHLRQEVISCQTTQFNPWMKRWSVFTLFETTILR
ncbi:1-acyl-sn-glycerol-3-phosphate acyltransferase [Thermoactinomyces sp. DSM 45891]|uniref:lysophospholipid acyltransferase family protein n=1 Tax=Thermoactinomyces sp. DSM 45891 TaxID=1761907 RepID=UPI00091625E8|nr:lysophospholipid acyltransferase family protein [Thermoactinomyces sp. DSM 45891]SFX65227.1 1-acyl-sn-glycerol-3-phosphate acyltransferase [Thermoactinomyces sp. DSM 45891]